MRDNTGAIIGGVVAVAVVALIAAVTVIVIVILVLRSRSANFTTPKTRLVYMPSKTLSLNKVWYIYTSIMYKIEEVYYTL